ncbi:hypothetical protein DFR57_101152 [Saliterribacillus persicus]|uniref:Uncharacterized protein n=1 Tax=Saliterribacillus persicus TaxID=930114 RepID=A0A368YAK9_9BACI|nr:hypothetical protein DFR57_101152 [Saliterribacillus persicus]
MASKYKVLALICLFTSIAFSFLYRETQSDIYITLFYIGAGFTIFFLIVYTIFFYRNKRTNEKMDSKL